MYKYLWITLLLLLSGCGKTAYNPHYIISDSLQEVSHSADKEQANQLP